MKISDSDLLRHRPQIDTLTADRLVDIVSVIMDGLAKRLFDDIML